jgi:hypothetical protein
VRYTVVVLRLRADACVWDAGAFCLVGSAGAVAYLWLGTDYGGSADAAVQLAAQFARQRFGDSWGGSVEVQRQELESEAFWELFESGY